MSDDNEPQAFGIPISQLPPALQQMLMQAIQQMENGEEEEEEESLGMVCFKLDAMLDQHQEPRTALFHARLHALHEVGRKDLDHTLANLHSYEEVTAKEILTLAEERVAFVETIRAGLKHPDEIIALFRTDYALNDIFLPFFASLRELLREWKENPLGGHPDSPEIPE